LKLFLARKNNIGWAYFKDKNYIGLKLLTRYAIFFSVRKKTVWEKIKIKINGSTKSQELLRRQLVDINRLGGNLIVMKMGNR
jgi:hypothetical protein